MQNETKEERIITVLEGIGSKYAVHLRFDNDKELDEVIDALKPLGYRFHFPVR
jgi:hypothetical protein